MKQKFILGNLVAKYEGSEWYIFRDGTKIARVYEGIEMIGFITQEAITLKDIDTIPALVMMINSKHVAENIPNPVQ